MKKVDYKDGKFKITEIYDGRYDKGEVGILPSDVVDEYSEESLKDVKLPPEVQTCLGVDGTFHIRVDINGWKMLTKEQAAKLAYTIINFVES